MNSTPERLARVVKRGLVAALAVLCACQAPPQAPATRSHLLVVGIDGADPGAILTLIRRGSLPNFKRVLSDGWMMPLETDYRFSPIIWTTMVTGVRPEEHGITDFFVEGSDGKIPISSAARKRPALWNMLDRTGRRIAMLGMWATWPAEPTRGLIVSDRLGLGLKGEVSPPERQSDLSAWLEAAKAGGIEFGHRLNSPYDERIVTNDRVVTMAASQVLREGGFDLVFTYYRSVDIASHAFWHLFEPEKFPNGPPDDVLPAPSADPVSDAYNAVDQALGVLLDSMPSDWNLMIVSDHGFGAETSGNPQLPLIFDNVLEQLGFLQRISEGGPPDKESSLAWTVRSAHYDWTKRVQLSSSIAAAERDAIEADLVRKIKTCEFSSGARAFDVWPVPERERRAGTDVIFRIRGQKATRTLLCAGKKVENAIYFFQRQTGSHGQHDPGILITKGPIFRLGPIESRVSIFDLTPTILYALGLPVARDFAGQAVLPLFSDSYRESHGLREISSWGLRKSGEAVTTDSDERLLDELGAIGYLR